MLVQRISISISFVATFLYFAFRSYNLALNRKLAFQDDEE